MKNRNILVCVSGMSPAIVTETLYALVNESPAFIPDEIHIITTLDGKDKIQRELLDPQQGRFHAFMHDYLPQRSIRFDASTVHVIGVSRPAAASPFGQLPNMPKAGKVQEELKDIATAEDNEAAANTIYGVLRELKSQPGTRLHASVAGGRKSMSFYMGHAFSLLAEAEDRLSHVLVNEPFENPQLGFYYPPREPVLLSWTDRQQERHSISTAQADIKLAQLSVLKLGALLGKNWPEKAQDSFEFAVRLAQAAVEPERLKVVLTRDRETDQLRGSLSLCGETIDLQPQEFVVFAIYALARAKQCKADLIDAKVWNGVFADNAGDKQKDKSFNVLSDLKPIHSHIHDALRKVVGDAVAEHFRIKPVGKKGTGKQRPYALGIASDKLDVSALEHADWWDLLCKELTRAVPQPTQPTPQAAHRE